MLYSIGKNRHFYKLSSLDHALLCQVYLFPFTLVLLKVWFGVVAIIIYGCANDPECMYLMDIPYKYFYLPI